MKIILFALLSAICILRIPAVMKVKESRASWLASAFGLAALYVLGIVTPLEVIDSHLGGINVANLLQSTFALLAIFFFNDSVRQLANIPHVRWTYYAPLLGIPVMIFCFAMIDNKAPTAVDFIHSRMGQLATAGYSGIYMLAVLLTVLRTIYMLRHKTRGLYTVISAGWLVVAGACFSHLTYVVLFHFSPWQEIAQDIGLWFYRLFYVGLSVTALGWLALFLSKQVPRMRRLLPGALWLTALRMRVEGDRWRFAPIWDLLNETLENGIYKSLIHLHNYERANQTSFREPTQEKIVRIETKLGSHF